MSFPSVLSAYIAIVIISVVVIALLLVVVATVTAVLPEPHLVEGRAVRRKVATRPVADGGGLNTNE